MPAIKRGDLTPSDVVLLRLLAERPMHGHEASKELNRRGYSAWAGASRPQVYSSLHKLARMDLIRVVEIAGPPPKNGRRVFSATAKSRRELAKTLRRRYWVTESFHSRFLSWLRLRSGLDLRSVKRQLRARRDFLEQAIESTTCDKEPETGRTARLSKTDPWVEELYNAHLRAELLWLQKIERIVRCSDGPNRNLTRIV